MKRTKILLTMLTTGLASCGPEMSEPSTTTGEAPSFEEFEASTYHEDFEGGVYIVNGDTPIVDIKALEAFWSQLYGQGDKLIVHQSGNADAKWSDAQKLDLTYCVSSTSFGARHATAVAAMASAADAWEAVANVDFIHVADQDGSCTASNPNVLFDVRQVSNQPYTARAFFPGDPRQARNVLIDSSAFNLNGPWTLTGVLRHELGHTIGFRHEHTRPESGTCFEDNQWRPLTPYDSESVMHYPQCNGTQNGDLVITDLDAAGAASLYGPPGEQPENPEGTPRTGSASGSVALGQWVNYQPLTVLAGTTFNVDMTGTGDPDLYVRWGARPTRTRYNCRPYLDGPVESCELTVPAGESSAYISVRGYAAGTYTLTASWVEP